MQFTFFDAAVTVELVSYDPSAEVVGLPNISVPENGTNLTLLCAQLSGGVTSERNVTVILSTGTGTAEGTIYCWLKLSPCQSYGKKSIQGR